MSWYKQAKVWNQEIIRNPNFIGFHCQQSSRNPDLDDYIKKENNYAEDFYMEILDALPFQLRDIATEKGLLTHYDIAEARTYKFYEWVQDVSEFLSINDIRWIFVSQNKPLEDHYGPYRYYVLLPEDAILHIFDDPWVDDIAWAYLYNANVASPNCIELNPEEDGYEDN